MSIVSGDFLEDTGVNDFQNALDFTSGIARQNNFGGVWDSFAIRGFAGDENLPSGYLVNGFSAGRGFSGQRDTSNVESIEVLKGPGSALYGRSEPGGTINIITKKPQFEEEGYIQASIGSFNLFRLEGDYTNAITEDLAYRLNGAYEDSESFRDTVESKKLSLTPSISYNISAETNLAYEIEILKQQTPFDRGIFVLNGDFDTVPKERFFGEPNDGPMEIEAVGHQLTLRQKMNENWVVLAGINYRDSSFKGFSTDVELSAGRQLLYVDAETVSRQRRFRDYDSTDLSVRVEIRGSTHHILFGGDAYDYKLSQILERWRVGWASGDTTYSVNRINPVYGQAQPETARLWDQKETQRSSGVYIQDKIDITDEFKVLPGIRFDDFEKVFTNLTNGNFDKQSQTATSPRIGLVYEASELYTMYVSYSEGFRPNTGIDFRGDSFEPEESSSYEIGFKFNNTDSSLNGTVAIYSAEKSNVLSADPVNRAFSAALGEAESEGLEVDLNAYINDSIKLTLAYAYTDAVTSNDIVNFDWGVEIPAGSRLINIPKHKFSLVAMYETLLAGKETNTGASITYVGNRLGETIDQNYVLPSYTRVNIFAAVDLTGRLVLNANIDNLLDEEYFGSSYSALWTQPGTPINARINIKYKF
ncbi:MAG: TonB-dependent siderophore receptor [Kangiellaceae bacterium]|nr:TonB-dependent siderophore receptor [Kangiellaceae bacterium]